MEDFMAASSFRSSALLICAFVVATFAPGRHAGAQEIVTSQTRQVLSFYGGRSAYNTLNEMPRRSPIQPASSGPLQHNGKPFQGTTTGPTVSPYLNLFRDER